MAGTGSASKAAADPPADDFSFPVLKQPLEDVKKLPLTAFSTVVDRSAGGQDGAPVALAKAPRSKLPLEKGYSQVDWLRLSKSDADLNGLSGQPTRRDITLAEVAQHSTAADAWMVIRGRVYNVTPYLKFHPGGAAILIKAAGGDASDQFAKHHPWVAVDALLAKCLVGLLEQ